MITKKLAVVAIVLIVLLTGFLLWWSYSLLPVNPAETATKQFVISQGDGVREIAKNLRNAGLIRDQVAFFLLVRYQLNLDKKIQAGTYQLSPSLSAKDLAEKLTVGKEDLTITILEGWRNEEILMYLKGKGFTDTASFLKSVYHQEGRFFPDTYEIPRGSTTEQAFTLFRQNFAAKVTFPVSNDQLIVASLIEREAKYPQDRPLVASVIYNRLQAGMALDIDATVQYALGYSVIDGWKRNLTTDDLAIKSPYNTYLNPGLPPTPICNPGLSAIEAAINPAKTNYFYYLTGRDGQMHYAKTLDEHNANIAKYL